MILLTLFPTRDLMQATHGSMVARGHSGGWRWYVTGERFSSVEDEQFLGMSAGDICPMFLYLMPRALPVKMATKCYVHFAFYNHREGKC